MKLDKKYLSDRFVFSSNDPTKWSRSIKNQLEPLGTKIKGGVYIKEFHSCVVCDGRDFAVLAEIDRYGFPITTVMCKNCGLVQTNPYFRAKDYADFYINHYFEIYRAPFRSVPNLFQHRVYQGQWILRFLSKHVDLEQGSLVLDVGCGSGGILSTFREAGYQVIGVDYDKEVLKHGRKLNLDLRVGNIFHVNLTDNPSLIIYSHVLEHIRNVNEELCCVNEILRDDCFLYIELPGVKSIRYNVMQADLLHDLHFAHIWHFSLTTLTNLMLRNGFELVAGNESIAAVFRKTATNFKIINDYINTSKYLDKTEKYRNLYQRIARFRLKFGDFSNGARSRIIVFLRHIGLYENIRKVYLRHFSHYRNTDG